MSARVCVCVCVFVNPCHVLTFKALSKWAYSNNLIQIKCKFKSDSNTFKTSVFENMTSVFENMPCVSGCVCRCLEKCWF